jgi:hypothetical protein
MERERPEYLQPIEQRRWEFPWLAVIAAALIALMAGGVHMLSKTHAAWNQRFSTAATPSESDRTEAKREAELAEIKLRQTVAARDADLEKIRQRRARAERDSKAAQEDDQYRCIQGTLFRRIPGGWENLPGQSC